MSRFILLILFSLLASSCEKKLLEPKIDSFLTTENAIVDLVSLQSAVNGCYDGLQDVSYYGRDFIAMGDICSDNCQISPHNSDLFTDLYALSPTVADKHLDAFWKAAYVVIDRCNRSIDGADKLSALDPEKCLQLKSEAIFIRSLTYFDLIRLFASSDGETNNLGVPYISSVSDSVVSPKRENLSKIYDLIIEDLLEAKSGLKFNGPFIASSDAVSLLLSRIYLYKNDYINAYKQAIELVLSERYELLTYENYIEANYDEANSESVFSLQFNNQDFNRTGSLGYLYSPAGYAAYRADNSLLNLYSGTDIRRKMYEIADGSYSSKYATEDQTLGTANIPILRYSEALLTIIEVFNLNKLDEEASEYLEMFMFTRDPNIRPVSLSGSDLQTVILQERRKEFAFEGHRFFDLKRLKKALNRWNCNKDCNIPYSDRFVFPIPQSEINANPNIIQNN